MRFWFQMRLSVLICTFCVGLVSNCVQAIGIGEATVHTEIFQPLRAEIALLDVAKLSKDKIAVKLASHDDFKRVGIDFQYSLVDLKFEVVFDKSGKKYIAVTSDKPIRESYLHFLIEVNELDKNSYKPVKSFLREYTLLLNAPLHKPEPVTAAVSGEVKSIKGDDNLDVVKPDVTTAKSSNISSINGNEYRTVKGDTLFKIATRMGAGKNVHQAMIAILELNPKAFIGGNVNLVKAGVVLRLPDQQKINQVNKTEALATVREHNQSWRSGIAGTSKQLDATKRSKAGIIQTTIEQDNVRVVAGGSSAQQEQLRSVQSENADLKNRLDSLQSQIDQLNRLVELKDQQLSQLQKSLTNDRKEKEQLPNASTEATPVAPIINKPEQPINSPPTRQQPQPPAPPEDLSMIDQVLNIVSELLENTLILTAVGGLFALGIIGLLVKKLLPNIGKKKVIKKDSDELDDSELAILEQARASVASSSAISEADSFIDYGQYSEAKDVLLAAINETPSNIDLRFKLLEVLGELGESTEFELHKKQVIAIGGDDAANKIITLENAYPDLSNKAKTSEVNSNAAIEDDDVFKDLDGFEPDSTLDELDSFNDFTEVQEEASSELAVDNLEGNIELGEVNDFSSDSDISFEISTLSNDQDDNVDNDSLDITSDDGDLLDAGLNFDDLEDDLSLEKDNQVNLEEELEISDANSEEFFASLDINDSQDEVILEDLSDASLDLEETNTNIDLDNLELAGDLQELDNSFELDLVGQDNDTSSDSSIDTTLDLDSTETSGINFTDGDADNFELNLLDSADEITTKFELAQAYIEMGDSDGAKEILHEILKEGDANQQAKAREMIDGLV